MSKDYMKARWPEGLSLAFVAIMFTLAVIGVWISFSPVPYWDMWNGTLSFILDIQDGQPQRWWAQHNEHRIILSRILFFLDYEYFGGLSYLLIPLNITFACLSALIFLLFAKMLNVESGKPRKTLNIVGIIIVGFTFSWMQYENFTWGFQSQFFLAQLLPLAALYFLARSTDGQSVTYFITAMVLGTVSAGTMANGVVILPIMALYLCIIWQSLGRLLSTMLLAVFVSALYFWDYTPIDHHGSIGETLATDPLGMLYYTFIYLGSPLYHILMVYTPSRNLAAIAGLLLVVFSVVIAYWQIRLKQRSPYVVALLCFLIYLGGTAFGTAGGRALLGIGGATSSRYTTPAIMAWAAFVLAVVASFPRPSGTYRIVAWGGVALICIQSMVYQIEQLNRQVARLFDWESAALALELGVRDESTIVTVFPSVNYVVDLSARAKAQNLSVFGSYPLDGLSELQGQPIAAREARACVGHLDTAVEIDGDENYLRISGWIFDPASHSVPKVLTFTNEQGVIVGAGLSGQQRQDVRDVIDPAAFTAGYGGYVSVLEPGTRIIAVGDAPRCQLMFTLPG
jgi:hypothetical protein